MLFPFRIFFEYPFTFFHTEKMTSTTEKNHLFNNIDLQKFTTLLKENTKDGSTFLQEISLTDTENNTDLLFIKFAGKLGGASFKKTVENKLTTYHFSFFLENYLYPESNSQIAAFHTLLLIAYSLFCDKNTIDANGQFSLIYNSDNPHVHLALIKNFGCKSKAVPLTENGKKIINMNNCRKWNETILVNMIVDSQLLSNPVQKIGGSLKSRTFTGKHKSKSRKNKKASISNETLATKKNKNNCSKNRSQQLLSPEKKTKGHQMISTRRK